MKYDDSFSDSLSIRRTMENRVNRIFHGGEEIEEHVMNPLKSLFDVLS